MVDPNATLYFKAKWAGVRSNQAESGRRVSEPEPAAGVHSGAPPGSAGLARGVVISGPDAARAKAREMVASSDEDEASETALLAEGAPGGEDEAAARSTSAAAGAGGGAPTGIGMFRAGSTDLSDYASDRPTWVIGWYMHLLSNQFGVKFGEVGAMMGHLDGLYANAIKLASTSSGQQRYQQQLAGRLPFSLRTLNIR